MSIPLERFVESIGPHAVNGSKVSIKNHFLLANGYDQALEVGWVHEGFDSGSGDILTAPHSDLNPARLGPALSRKIRGTALSVRGSMKMAEPPGTTTGSGSYR